MGENYKYTKEFLEPLVKISSSWAEVVRHTGGKARTGTQGWVAKQAKKHGIDFSHFTGQRWNSGRTDLPKRHIQEYLTLNGLFIKSHDLRLRLIKEGLKEYKCEGCGRTKWRGKPIPLELDHINGKHEDHRIENLRILCPNCHAQTETYCRRKDENGNPIKFTIRKRKYTPKPKEEIVRYKKNNPKLICECGKEKSRSSVGCKSCDVKNRMVATKIEWPSIDVLLQMIKESNYLQVGKSLGVSDNAVRKHVKKRI
jgi:5-methylcytosine-specific restriction endonuclease McrA